MNYSDFFNSKTKPNVNNYTNDDLIYIINKNYELNYQTDQTDQTEQIEQIEQTEQSEQIDYNLYSKEKLIQIVNDIWDNLVLGSDITCPICLDFINNKNNMITKCGHYFHSSCMIKYIVKSKSNDIITCPQCRSTIYQEYLEENNIASNVTNTIINNNLNNDLNNDYDNNERILDYFNYNFPINLNTGMWVDYNFNNHISVNISNNVNHTELLDNILYNNNNINDLPRFYFTDTNRYIRQDSNIHYFNSHYQNNNYSDDSSSNNSLNSSTSSDILVNYQENSNEDFCED